MQKEKFEKEISELEEMAWSFRQRWEQHYSKNFYLPATSILNPEAHLDASANHTKARLSPHKEDTGFSQKKLPFHVAEEDNESLCRHQSRSGLTVSSFLTRCDQYQISLLFYFPAQSKQRGRKLKLKLPLALQKQVKIVT